jgi:flagellar basal body rod protein FlgG
LVRGLYTAASGAIVAQANVDVIANNLANVNTSGFKRSLMQVEAGEKATIYRDQIDPGSSGERMRGVATHALVGQLGFGSQIYDTPTVFDQGAIQQTGNPLDVALSGPGFLAVGDAAGTTSYVRGGSFVANAQGQLATAAGDKLLGSDGKPIVVPAQGQLQIDRSGAISADAKAVGQLGVYEFANLAAVRPLGEGKFTSAGTTPAAAAATTVVQGAQQKSNADVIGSMVSLIANERWFDANQKMIQTQDTETGAAITTVGKTTG